MPAPQLSVASEDLSTTTQSTATGPELGASKGPRGSDEYLSVLFVFSMGDWGALHSLGESHKY